VTAIDLSRATMTCIKQNLFWALIYNAICIPIAAGVLYPFFGIVLSPMIGSAAMSISSVCVVLNSLRLRSVNIYGDGKKRRKERQQKEKKAERAKKTVKASAISYSCDQNSFHNFNQEEQAMFGKTKTVTFGVEGMMCNNCKAHVERALTEVKGVKFVLVDLEAKFVTVQAKDSVSENTLKDAVKKAGYKVL